MRDDPPRRRPGGAQQIPRPAAWRPGGPAPWGAQPGPVELERTLTTVQTRSQGPMPPPFPGARHSAVLVALHDASDGPEVLVTRRAMHLRNHRGEISFPGGRVDPGESPVETALREAWEEVALDPGLVTVHGQLDHLVTVVSQSYIVPVVATLTERPELRISPDEVDRALWVSLDELSHPDTYREEWWGTPPTDRPIYFFDLDDETIWGATARMLHQLLRLAHGVGDPVEPGW